jgi:short-subunit dehydrogenase
MMSSSVPPLPPRRPTALVTGASRGIGRAIATRLAAEGYDVTLSARDAAALDEVVGLLRDSAGQVRACPADLSRIDGAVQLAEAQRSLSHALDVLVLCAGTGTAGSLDDYPQRRIERQLSVNLLAPIRLVQGLLPALRTAAAESPARGAKVIALASIAGVASEPGLAVYGATKAALISLCESITVDAAGTGVVATAISPGYVDTDMSAWMHNTLAPEDMISPEDIAELALAVCRLSRNAAVPNIVVTRPGSQLWRA